MLVFLTFKATSWPLQESSLRFAPPHPVFHVAQPALIILFFTYQPLGMEQRCLNLIRKYILNYLGFLKLSSVLDLPTFHLKC